MTRRHLLRALSIAPLALAALVTSDRARADSLEDLFNRVRNAEPKDIPGTVAHVDIGSFDCATGAWSGRDPGGTPPPQYELGPDHKPRRIPGGPTKPTPQFTAFGTTVALEVTLLHRNGAAASLNALGHTGHAPSTGDKVSVNVGTAQGIFNPQVTCGSKTHQFAAPYDKYELISDWASGGGFTLEAIPVAILYQPPVDDAKSNYAVYASAESMGTTISSSYSSSNSSTKPAPTPFDSVGSFKSDAGMLASGLSKIPSPYTAAAAAALDIISSGLGSATASATNGHTSGGGSSLTVTMGESTSFPTTKGVGGPGEGDEIYVLKNPHFLWEAAEHMHEYYAYSDVLQHWTVHDLKADRDELVGVLRIAEITPSSPPDHVLRQATAHPEVVSRTGSRTGFSLATLLSLLALDPLAADPNADLPSRRFQPLAFDGAECVQAPFSKTVTKSQVSDDSFSSGGFQTTAKQYSKGWLSFLGIGVTQDENITSTMTFQRTRDNVSSSTQLATVHAHGANYGVKTYYDRLFGTLAFKRCSAS